MSRYYSRFFSHYKRSFQLNWQCYKRLQNDQPRRIHPNPEDNVILAANQANPRVSNTKLASQTLKSSLWNQHFTYFQR